MSEQVRNGVIGLCFAGVAAVLGVVLESADSSGAGSMARYVFVFAVVAGVASLLAIANGLSKPGDH